MSTVAARHHTMKRVQPLLNVNASSRRRLACLIGSALINAVFYAMLSHGLRVGGDGLVVDEAMTVYLLPAKPLAILAEAPTARFKALLVDTPRHPSPLVGDDVRTDPPGPPTETAESVRQRMDAVTAARRNASDDRYRCASRRLVRGRHLAPVYPVVRRLPRVRRHGNPVRVRGR